MSNKSEMDVISKLDEGKAVINEYYSFISNIKVKNDKINKMIMHELMTPIKNIESAMDSIKKDPKDFYELKEILKRNIDETKNLFPLIEIYKLSPEEIELQRKNIKLNKLILNKSQIYKNYLKNKSIRIYSNPSEESFLHPLLTNFMIGTTIGNSIKWAPKGTSIDIFLKKDKNYVKIIFENLKGSKPDEENIGMNLGLGKEIIKYSLEKIKGFQEEYSFPIIAQDYKNLQTIGKVTNPKDPLDKDVSGFYGVELSSPSEKGLVSRL